MSYGFQYFNPNAYGYPMGFQQGQQAPQMQQPTFSMPEPQTPQQAPKSGIRWCQGEAGAKAYQIPPGTSALLMDSEDLYLYIKTVDASGMPQALRKFRLTEETGQQTAPAKAEYVTREEFERFKAAFNKEVPNAESAV